MANIWQIWQIWLIYAWSFSAIPVPASLPVRSLPSYLGSWAAPCEHTLCSYVLDLWLDLCSRDVLAGPSGNTCTL
eukprot:scaffold327654_cov33-Prasinocladus_malaysianus.AAC.1